MKMLQLRDGPLIRENAVLFALDLEAQGVRMRLHNNRVVCEPPLSPDQARLMGGFEWDVATLLKYAQHPPEPR